ncbi:hypothetical protein RN001_011877 [Aquatica leii]|uniref:G-patch domain-containing protein n=1 Tax=Aquatica leii TaxID=1421715 RepID=A0AAN7NXW1_9COLE|nr:hypothetical protein RN001_011877 [Aquatica leii]
MDQANKKISFGFTKSTKKTLLFDKPLEKNKKIQLIDCLESQKIKIKNACEVVKGPLIIPMVQSTNLLDRRREVKKEKGLEVASEKPESELTVEELAARELIREAQNIKVENTGKLFVLPTLTENVIEIEGKPESTLEDYESVPIDDYGMAMLRGMGWNEGMGIGKNNKTIKVIEPPLRPKGMGLGASCALKKEQSKPAVDKDGKELILHKGSFAKIIDGKKKGCYCEVQGFDEEAGRVIVKTSLDGLILTLNEFLLVPVTKEEYSKSSKVINIQKYEEYKDQEGSSNKEQKQKQGSNSSKSSHKHDNSKKLKDRVRNSSSSSTEKRSQERRSRYSSTSSEEDQKYSKKYYKRNTEPTKNYDCKDKYKSKYKSKKNRSSSGSSVENDHEKRDSKGHRKQLSNDEHNSYRRDRSKSEKYKIYSSDSDLDSKDNHRKEKHRYNKYSHSSQKRR